MMEESSSEAYGRQGAFQLNSRLIWFVNSNLQNAI